jgi:hypothetical protein
MTTSDTSAIFLASSSAWLLDPRRLARADRAEAGGSVERSRCCSERGRHVERISGVRIGSSFKIVSTLLA